VLEGLLVKDEDVRECRKDEVNEGAKEPSI
jgi:hypothetical protein